MLTLKTGNIPGFANGTLLLGSALNDTADSAFYIELPNLDCPAASISDFLRRFSLMSHGRGCLGINIPYAWLSPWSRDADKKRVQYSSQLQVFCREIGGVGFGDEQAHGFLMWLPDSKEYKTFVNASTEFPNEETIILT